MAEPLRHRQTKGAATDMFSLQPPRHIPTLPRDLVDDRAVSRLGPRTRCGFMARRGGARVAGEAMAVGAERVMGEQLLPLPLTERSAHLCVDMLRKVLGQRHVWTGSSRSRRRSIIIIRNEPCSPLHSAECSCDHTRYTEQRVKGALPPHGQHVGGTSGSPPVQH
jgi:hypothetical protein